MNNTTQRKSVVLLLVLLFLLFIPSIVETIWDLKPSPTLISAYGFGLTLVGIYLNTIATYGDERCTLTG